MASFYSIPNTFLENVARHEMILFECVLEDREKLRIIWTSWRVSVNFFQIIGIINSARKNMCNAFAITRLKNVITSTNKPENKIQKIN